MELIPLRETEYEDNYFNTRWSEPCFISSCLKGAPDFLGAPFLYTTLATFRIIDPSFNLQCAAGALIVYPNVGT